jgi:hypothetical protein
MTKEQEQGVGRPRKRVVVESVTVPASVVAFIDRRTHALVRASWSEPDIIKALARSCYHQGLEDALAVMERGARP